MFYGGKALVGKT